MKNCITFSCVLFLSLAAAIPTAIAGDKHDGDKHHSGDIQGCLSQGEGENWYVLTKQKEDRTKEIKVMGDDSFAAHVGHEVKLTGTWQKSEEGKKHFKATGMEHVAATCGS